MFKKAELFARNRYDQQRKRERGTKLNSGSKPQGRQRRASSEEKVEGTRGQSTTREAPMGSVKRSGGSTSRSISIGYTLYIKEYLDGIHIEHKEYLTDAIGPTLNIEGCFY